MKLSRLGEFALIESIRRATALGRGVRLGIGDDAAWVESKSGSMLVTSDLLIEGIHFKLKWTSLFSLGYKAVAVNLSDIAAMGGEPSYLVLALGIPGNFDSRKVHEFYRGVKSLCSKTGLALIGGDTNASNLLIISVCLMGHAPYPPVRRSGAKVGNDIYITGTLGDSALGLKLLQSGAGVANRRAFAYLVSRHHKPTARIRAGALIAQQRLATAMIDVSDGLLQDLGHICTASCVGAEILAARLPLSTAYRSVAGKDGLQHALTGGEDYELLFCARRRDRARIVKLQEVIQIPITRIGTCVPARVGITVLDRSGKRLAQPCKGYDHFRTA
jgi:thiamine-monophosphate kinase